MFYGDFTCFSIHKKIAALQLLWNVEKVQALSKNL